MIVRAIDFEQHLQIKFSLVVSLIADFLSSLTPTKTQLFVSLRKKSDSQINFKLLEFSKNMIFLNQSQLAPVLL